MLLTPQPESSNPASTAKSGTRVWRKKYGVWLMRWLQWSFHPSETALPRLRDDPLFLSLLGGFALRFREPIVIFLRANRVGHRERCQRIVKCAALSHVSREYSWIGRACMRAGERASA